MWFAAFSLNFLTLVTCQYVIDDSHGHGRTFDGIGGISGGGVSCLLT